MSVDQPETGIAATPSEKAVHALPQPVWQKLCDAYLGKNPADYKRSDLASFDRFLQGGITSDEYFADRHVREGVEALIAFVSQVKHMPLHASIDQILLRQIRAHKDGDRWQEQKERPDIRMYLDIAKVMHANFIGFIKGKYASHPRLKQLDIKVDETLTSALEEAYLSSRYTSVTNFSGFMGRVMRARLMDLHRRAYGRGTYSPPREFNGLSGVDDAYVLEGRVSAFDASSRQWGHVDEHQLVEILRQYCDKLPEDLQKVLQVFLQVKSSDMNADNTDMGEILGISKTTFNRKMRDIRALILKDRPSLGVQATRFLGKMPSAVAQFNESYDSPYRGVVDDPNSLSAEHTHDRTGQGR